LTRNGVEIAEDLGGKILNHVKFDGETVVAPLRAVRLPAPGCR
jgi:hypothetical protein